MIPVNLVFFFYFRWRDLLFVKLRALDLTRADVRQAVIEAKNAEALYKSAAAGDYA